MKRITLALYATFITLCTFAQGQIQTRLQSRPEIDSLIRFVKSQGGKASISYHYDGRLHKTININCHLVNEQPPTPSTGDEKQDTQNMAMHKFRLTQSEKEKGIYDAIRNTCKALSNDAQEAYIWEYHRNGMDSIRYAIALGQYDDSDAIRSYQNQRDIYYDNAPEILSFRYDTYSNNPNGYWKGFGSLRYDYAPDRDYKQITDFKPFNQEEYNKQLRRILKQKGITSRQFYVYHDSTYTFANRKDLDDDFTIRVNTITPKQQKSETRGTVYTILSKELADSVLSHLVNVTWNFLENNPEMDFKFSPDNNYALRGLTELFQHFSHERVPSFYHIYLNHVDNKEFNILVVEGTGDMIIPSEWLILKSWKNGKIDYNKKMKDITPQQARDNTRYGRMFIKRQFTPIDEMRKQ